MSFIFFSSEETNSVMGGPPVTSRLNIVSKCIRIVLRPETIQGSKLCPPNLANHPRCCRTGLQIRTQILYKRDARPDLTLATYPVHWDPVAAPLRPWPKGAITSADPATSILTSPSFRNCLPVLQSLQPSEFWLP